MPKKGFKHSKESKQKMTESQKNNRYFLGKHLDEDHRNKISNSLKGHTFTNETKEKISKTLTGRKSSKETKEKISKANIGKHRMTEEAKQKLRTNELRKKKISKSMLKLWEEGKIEIKSKNYYKSGYYDSMLQGKIWLRSSSELRFATFLDLMSGFGAYFVWLYEAERYTIKNEKGEIESTYCPDFWILPKFSLKEIEKKFNTNVLNKKQVKELLKLNEVQHIVDIKGWFDKKHSSYEKIKKFRKQYSNVIFDIVLDRQEEKLLDKNMNDQITSPVESREALRNDEFVDEILRKSLERIGVSSKKYGNSYLLADMPKEIQEEIYDVFGWFLMSTSRLLRSFKDKVISIDNIFWDQFLKMQNEQSLTFLIGKIGGELLKRHPNMNLRSIIDEK